MSDFETILAQLTQFDWAQNTLAEYSLALTLFVITLFGLHLFIHGYFTKTVSKLVTKTKTQFDDIAIEIITSVGRPFYGILGIYIASQVLIIPEIIEVWIRVGMVLIFTFYAASSIQRLAVYSARKVFNEEGEDTDSSLVTIAKIAVGLIIWSIAILYVLSSFSINITALVGGLGITSIAVAFALQNVLAEIFASLAIYLDRPFQVGDFIIIGTDKGTVEHIGLKSTRIKSIDGEKLIVSNKELSEIRINNFSKLQRRRIEYMIGVEYKTTAKQLRDIPDIFERIIKEIEICEFDRVHFKEFGDSALLFEIVYFVNTSNYVTYMDAQQKINLEIKEEFEKAGINMAFPSQTIYLAK
jgi:small-conductance mechanosensitive channel